MPKVDFSAITDTEFEEFCFHLLDRLGFVNVDWRKGTALAASPADSGRDIVCQQITEDIDRTKRLETWFVDCKHYKKGVPPGVFQNLLTWGEAERPHTALFIASGFLSNPSKEYLEKYERNRRPPFRIKYCEHPTLEKLTTGRRASRTKSLYAFQIEHLCGDAPIYQSVLRQIDNDSDHQDLPVTRLSCFHACTNS
jgi:hypothetical protein